MNGKRANDFVLCYHFGNCRLLAHIWAMTHLRNVVISKSWFQWLSGHLGNCRLLIGIWAFGLASVTVSLCGYKDIRLVSVVVWVYLILTHVISAFFFPLAHHDFSSRLQLLAYSHISIRYIRLLFLSQHHHFRLNHFKIYSIDNEFEKIIV
jgi:hypothetical protein